MKHFHWFVCSLCLQEPAKCCLRDFSEGYLGKLRVRKSGKTELVLGNVVLDVSMGVPASFLQVSNHLSYHAGEMIPDFALLLFIVSLVSSVDHCLLFEIWWAEIAWMYYQHCFRGDQWVFQTLFSQAVFLSYSLCNSRVSSVFFEDVVNDCRRIWTKKVSACWLYCLHHDPGQSYNGHRSWGWRSCCCLYIHDLDKAWVKTSSSSL